MPPIQKRLRQALVDAVGEELADRYAEGLPAWQDSPGYMNMRVMLWLRNLVLAYDMLDYGRYRYNFLKSPDQFNLMNPLAFNPAAFMDPKTTSKFLYTIASGCDLFIFWGMLLTAIGLKAAAGKRLSFGGALFAVALPWAFFLLIGASIAGAFS